LQGDVVALLDSTGTEVVTYQYDTWGNQVSITGTKASTVGEKNPYRYRGYRYDSETKLYYLNARYYNPEWGRFLNADTFRGLTGDLLSHNAFAYAKNNPVMYVDPTGYFWKSIIKVTKKAVTKTAKVLILDDLQTLTDGKWDGNDVIAAFNLTPWGKAVKGANLAIKAGSAIKKARASTNGAVKAETNYLYRGVSAKHPTLKDAKEGRVIPGDVNGKVSANAHNLGGQADKSPFTSWTRDPKVAEFHAGKDGPGGVVLRVPTGAPPSSASWSWQWSPDIYGEQEVLLRGIRIGVERIK
jgi:RHS repeat-associated protein